MVRQRADSPVKIKTRSNRPLTQFACDELTKCIHSFKTDSYSVSKGNTRVESITGPKLTHCKIYLHDDNILSLILMDCTPVSLRLSFGSRFTEDGHPKKTTIERLNGLLDSLSVHMIIPPGVRIFRDKLSDCYYLGKGEDKIMVGKNYATCLMLKPSPSDFQIEASNIQINNMMEEDHINSDLHDQSYLQECAS